MPQKCHVLCRAPPSTLRARARVALIMNTHRSPPPMLQVDRPGAACSAAPTFSLETLIAIFTSRGKSFVLRKCVLGLRLLTQREAFALSRAMTMARRLPLGADSNVAQGGLERELMFARCGGWRWCVVSTGIYKSECRSAFWACVS